MNTNTSDKNNCLVYDTPTDPQGSMNQSHSYLVSSPVNADPLRTCRFPQLLQKAHASCGGRVVSS